MRWRWLFGGVRSQSVCSGCGRFRKVSVVDVQTEQSLFAACARPELLRILHLNLRVVEEGVEEVG